MLFPYEPEEFWLQLRMVVREEMGSRPKEKPDLVMMEVPGLLQKPLYKISEICKIFTISRPTVYKWVKDGKLRQVKIRSRVFFLGDEVRGLMQ